MAAMLERVTVRTLPLTNRAADFAPVVPACCNVCRTCTTTNIVGLASGGALALGYGVARFGKRLVGRASNQ
jgi:hypothetical protein